MKAYIDGRLSKDNDLVDFTLFDLWFADLDYDGDLKESEDCILVSGFDTHPLVKNKIYYDTWDTVVVNGKEINDISELKKLLKDKHLINGMACFNDDVILSGITVGFETEGGNDWTIPYNRICNNMEFIN